MNFDNIKKTFSWKVILLTILAVAAAGMVWYAVLLSVQ